jgi:hypothetical protein
LQTPQGLIILSLVATFIKSERMALDKTTQANGITHYFKLANEALKVIPPDTITKVEKEIPGSEEIIHELGES